MTTLAVIIARAGSKGLSNKSMQLLADKPIIAYTIEHALGSRRVDHVVLSSDCPRILDVARQYDITAYERPVHRATDQSKIDDGARHGIECWERDHDRHCYYVAILYGNIPLRPADLTDRALLKLIETEADSVQSVYHVGKMHPLWYRKLTGPRGDVLENYQPNETYRRQDLPPVYMLDAGVLVMQRDVLFGFDPSRPHSFLGRDRRAVVTQPGEVVDVDTPLDLALAEVLLKHRHSKGTVSFFPSSSVKKGACPPQPDEYRPGAA